MVSTTKYLTKRPFSKFCQFTPKLPTILEEECEVFEPFGSNYPVTPGTLKRFIFVERFGHLIDENTPQSDLPPSCFPPLTYHPITKPPRKDPPSRGINHLEDQIECISYYVDLIKEILDDKLPIPAITKFQQLEKCSPVEILAKKLRKMLAADGVKKEPTWKGLKHFLSLPALKQRMSGSVRK